MLQQAVGWESAMGCCQGLVVVNHAAEELRYAGVYFGGEGSARPDLRLMDWITG